MSKAEMLYAFMAVLCALALICMLFANDDKGE